MTLVAAQDQARAIANDLGVVRYRLLGVQASLPPSPQESSQEDWDGDPDAGTELRTVIGHGVLSCLDPLIRDLQDAADYQPMRVQGRPKSVRRSDLEPTPGIRLDLSAPGEATRRTLYALVTRDNFTAREVGPPGDVWVPAYTPEQAGLEVFYAHGRWFATWVKLEESPQRPESERRELLVLEEDPERRGSLRYTEV
jgi:hypothetical protein